MDDQEYDIPVMMMQAHILNKNQMLLRDMAFYSLEMSFRLKLISLEEFENRSNNIAEQYRPKTWRELINKK